MNEPANNKAPAYNCEPLAELARELGFSKPPLRARQMRRAEKLHDEITPDATYPLDYLAYRVTGVRPSNDQTVLLIGEAVRPDLRRLIDAVSRSLDLPAGEDRALTSGQLAQRLKVSTKTIRRWRKQGLRWRWVVDDAGSAPGGASGKDSRGASGGTSGGRRKKIAFTEEAVSRFVAENRERVESAGAFTHLPEDQREALIRRARRIRGRADVSLNRVADHLATKTGRALQTLRMILEKHDREHPEDMIFADRTGPLSPRQKRVIARAYQWGIGVGALSERFGRTRSTIYRAVHERRAASILREPIHYIKSPTFDREDADSVYLRTGPGADTGRRRIPADYDDLPRTLGPLYRRSVMSEAHRRSLVLRYNYLKFKADQLRKHLDRREPRVTALDHFDKCIAEARRVRSRIVTGALPLVLSVVRRNLVGKHGKSKLHLVRLLETGNQVLIDAVEAFDATRNTTFESFLTNRLLRRFAREDAAGDADRPVKAVRRLSDTEVLKRMVDQAGESGVALTLDPEVADDTPDH